jgi:acetylornithine deacetylase
MRYASVSGEEREVTEYLRDWAGEHGLACDLWCATDDELETAAGPLAAHKPFVDRPTLVITLAGTGGGRSLMFNGHSDVVSAQSAADWTSDPFGGEVRDGSVWGRGACDTKGPIAAALWAIAELAADREQLAGDVMLEIVPGEEDSVGLGTLSSILRGHRADGAIILEPTSGLPRCASRPGCRFEVTARGRSVHGSTKWLGADALKLMRRVQDGLDAIEERWNDAKANMLFSGTPVARPVTVDTIRGGEWQGMVCDRCSIGGYLELLPGDEMDVMCERLRTELLAYVAGRGEDANRVTVSFGEQYAGHQTDPGEALCRTAETVIAGRGANSGTAWSGWAGFNSGCEAGMRAGRLGTPTLVWGPGELEHAHACDEKISVSELILAAAEFKAMARHWCDIKEIP